MDTRKQLSCRRHAMGFLEPISLKSLSFRIINLLLGFFMATILATIPGQTGDWGIIGSGIIIGCAEYISKCVYQKRSVSFRNYYNFLNDIKIGIIYGLFVDSFKLGS